MKFIERFKPAAPATIHLFLAALLWTAVGAFLLWRGMDAVWSLSPGLATIVLAVGVVIGALKGRFVLRPSAREGVARIIERGDGKCLGGFLSWKSWLFVLAMGLFGKTLRSLSLPPWFIGALLTAVGVALWWGSSVFWGSFFSRIRD